MARRPITLAALIVLQLSFALGQTLLCNGPTVDFNTGIPLEWTVVNNAGANPVVWSDLAGCGEPGNYTGGGGDAACASSDLQGSGLYDTELISDPLFVYASGPVELSYLANYQNFGNVDILALDVSDDDGSSWNTLLNWNDDHPLFGFRSVLGEEVTVDLSAYAGEEIRLRWRYYDPSGPDTSEDWYAQLDDVTLTCTLAGSIDFEMTAIVDPTPETDDDLVCGTETTLVVEAGTPIDICYRASNDSNARLSVHDLVGSEFGTILAGFPFDLDPGSSVFLVVSDTVDTTTVYDGTWTASNPGADSSADSASITVAVNVDLALAQTAVPDPVRVGAPLAFTLTVSNLGAATASGVTVTDTLPANSAFVSAVPSQGTCSEAGGVVDCDLGALPGISSATIVLTVTPTSTGAAANTALVSSIDNEVAIGDNLAVATVAVDPALAALGVATGPAAPAGPVGASAGDADVTLLQLALAPDPGSEPLELMGLSVSVEGSGDDRDLARVALVRDADADGAVGPGDAELASGTFAADDGALTLTLATPEPIGGAPLLLVVDLPTAAAALPIGALAGALPLLAALLWRRRRRIAGALALGGLALLLTACPAVQPPAPPTHTLTVEGVAAAGAVTATPATVSGLPIAAATLETSP